LSKGGQLMSEELFIPKLGQTVDEVTIVDWLVEDGARVEFGTPLLDVETDKAVFPIESPVNGYLHRGPFKAGDIVPVLTIVALIGKKDEAFKAGSVETMEKANEEPQEAALEVKPSISPGQETASRTSVQAFISPRAKKLAAEKQVDISQVTPTGYGGIRIVERDISAYLSQQPAPVVMKVTPVAQNIAEEAGLDLAQVSGTGVRGMVTKADVEQVLARTVPSPALSIPESGPEISNRIPLKGVKSIIFERMGASVHTTARVTLVIEADATQFVQARDQLKASVSEAWGFAPGYNDLIALIVARALKEFPFMNARLARDSASIEWLSHVNLGMAVDTERGLVVPVIRDAHQKGLKAFGSEFRALVDRARAGRSLPDDLSGGTFTITNLGMYDIDAFTPVINLPEIAILGLGRIAPKVVPVNNQPAIRQMWTLSLVFDHRLVDGAPAARFLQKIKQMVENPYLLLV
jgi:pyruvate dehydrogenase E2 component (dihydrolipoamide acetyltransferase)